tara:strand:+ start:223 stop:525 length:303 start_codon:yes stop_codon:yes gene_type:complete
MGERTEVFMRLFVGIVSGIIFTVWRWLIIVFVIINWFYTLFTGKRIKELANLSEIWNTQWYIFQRYLIFVSNKRPFPFTKLEKSMSKHDSRAPRHFKKKR